MLLELPSPPLPIFLLFPDSLFFAFSSLFVLAASLDLLKRGLVDAAVQQHCHVEMVLVRWKGAAHATDQQRFCPLQVLQELLQAGGRCCPCCPCCPGAAGAVLGGGLTMLADWEENERCEDVCCLCCCPPFMCKSCWRCRVLQVCCPCCLTKETSNGTKIRKMNKISDFRDDPTTKLKMVISFCMYLQIG
jgi:hypothetical protein